MLQAAGCAALAYLDGLVARGQESLLVIAAADESPFDYYSGMREVQWDVFPSAMVQLRGEGRADRVNARVAVVPRLWADALSEPDGPHMGGEFMVLAYELPPLGSASEICTAVGQAVSRSCGAAMLSCRRWFPTAPTRVAHERSAREATASVLARRAQM